MIRIEHLNKYYNKGSRNEYHVINDMTYEFDEKGLYVFFGPSGCGKTTLLNVLGALDSFDSGSITYFDQVFSKYKSNRADEFRNRNIGYIYQNYNLIDSKSVSENIEVILDIIGLDDINERKNRVRTSLEAVGMYKYRKRNVTALSGGQRQRVAIARALAKNPKIILADEPTGNLDSNNTFEVMNIIKTISKDRLVILVSHEKDLVDFYADKIIELRDGKIIDTIENNKSQGITRGDSRNIYLKDYSKEEVKSKSISMNLYRDSNDDEAHFDVIFKNGEIYVKTISKSKIHYIDESSEVKLIDSTEGEFMEEINKKESSFNLDSYNNTAIEGKGYINFFKGAKDAFKGSSYLKRSKFSKFVLLLVGIIFAFMFSSFSKSVSIDKKDYIKTADNVVLVTMKYKDEKDGLSISKLYNDIKDLEYFESMVSTDSYSRHYLTCNLGRFYQTQNNWAASNIRIESYLLKNSGKSYNIKAGRTISSNDEIVISSWTADAILNQSSAKINGYFDYEDLVGLKVDINLFQNATEVTIVGVSDTEYPVSYIKDEAYPVDNMAYSSGYESVYISTSNKKAMIEHIKSLGYSTVKDPLKNAGWSYFKENLRSNLGTVIALLVIIVAIITYLALMIRASLFQKIKEIGILRSIGATKKDIMSIFTGEMFAFTTLTTLISYTATYLIIIYFNRNFGTDLFRIMNPNLITYFLGLILIYLITELSSIVPVLILMHKTPVEIIKKYDI